jgi:hypothetical protein
MLPAVVYRMGGMSKGIDYLWLRFSEFVTFYTFCRLALNEGVANLESYSWKSIVSSSHCMTRQSVEAELGEELRQTKDLVQQLLQSNQKMQQEYQAMQYMMTKLIISTSAICQRLIFIETEELIINEWK